MPGRCRCLEVRFKASVFVFRNAEFFQTIPDNIHADISWMYEVIGIETVISKLVKQYFVCREVCGSLRECFQNTLESDVQG